MALTDRDLGRIQKIVADIVTDAVSGLATQDDLDRMEGRLTSTMSLLERDSFQRLDEHEVRIARLEKQRS